MHEKIKPTSSLHPLILSATIISHQVFRSFSVPTDDDASSASQTFITFLSSLIFSKIGSVASANRGIAKLSPWVVPSADGISVLQTNKRLGARYILMAIGENAAGCYVASPFD